MSLKFDFIFRSGKKPFYIVLVLYENTTGNQKGEKDIFQGCFQQNK